MFFFSLEILCRWTDPTSDHQLLRARTTPAARPWWDPDDDCRLPDTLWEQRRVRHAQSSPGWTGQDTHEEPGRHMHILHAVKRQRDCHTHEASIGASNLQSLCHNPDWQCHVHGIFVSCRHADRQGVDILSTVCLFFPVIFLFCTVMDFSNNDKNSGIKFCTVVHQLALTRVQKPTPGKPSSKQIQGSDMRKAECSILHNSGNIVFGLKTNRRWDLDPKINGFPGLNVEHLYVKFGDPGCIGFWDIMCGKKQTDNGENSTHTTVIGIGNKRSSF